MKNLVIILTFIYLINSTTYADTNSLKQVQEAFKNLESKVITKTLSNGIRVIFYKRGIAPVFSGVISIRVGGVNEKVGETGISHMLEHMAFKGTPEIGTLNYNEEKKLLAEIEGIAKSSNRGRDLTKEQKEKWKITQAKLSKLYETKDLTEILNSKGVVDFNATTDKDLTNFFESLPSSEFEFWAKMEADRLTNTVFRQFYKERQVVLEERRMRYEDSPEGKLYEKLLSLAYDVHPYRNPVIGYLDDVSGLLASEVEDFQKKYYVSENIIIGIVGAIDHKKAMPILEKYFAKVSKEKSPKRYPHSYKNDFTGERTIQLFEDSEKRVYIAYHKPNYPHKDDAPLSLYNEVLLGSSISPLYKILVEQKKILSQINHFEAPGNAYPNLMLYELVPNSKYTNEQAITAFDKELSKIIKAGLKESDIEVAKRSILTSYIGRLQSNLSLARDFTSSWHLYGDWSAFLDWQNEVSKVTANDLNRVAKKYFNNDKRVIAKLSKKKLLY